MLTAPIAAATQDAGQSAINGETSVGVTAEISMDGNASRPSLVA